MRDVFHSCRPEVALLIEQGGMKPTDCPYCLRQTKWIDHDQGWFGDHSKGVYVSKHADYTFFHSAHREPVPGDKGVVVMLELVTGRVRRMDERPNGAKPSPGSIATSRQTA